MIDTQGDIVYQMFIDEALSILAATTRKQPYMRNAIQRLKAAIIKLEVGKYTRGSI